MNMTREQQEKNTIRALRNFAEMIIGTVDDAQLLERLGSGGYVGIVSDRSKANPDDPMMPHAISIGKDMPAIELFCGALIRTLKEQQFAIVVGLVFQEAQRRAVMDVVGQQHR